VSELCKQNANASPASASKYDPNANVEKKSIVTASGEIPKEEFIGTNRLMMIDRLTEMYGADSAKKHFHDLKSHIIYKSRLGGMPRRPSKRSCTLSPRRCDTLRRCTGYLPTPSRGVVLPNPTRVKKPARKMDAYTDEDQKKLRKVLRSQAREGYAAIEFMLETGMRVGEALALDWRNVDLGRRTVRIEATVVRLANKKQSHIQHEAKSASTNRTIPLSTRAMEILTELRFQSNSPWVFRGKDGERITYEALRYQIKIATEEAGVGTGGCTFSGTPLQPTVTTAAAMLRFRQNFSATQMSTFPTTPTSTFSETRLKRCGRLSANRTKTQHSALAKCRKKCGNSDMFGHD
jgi:integrase